MRETKEEGTDIAAGEGIEELRDSVVNAVERHASTMAEGVHDLKGGYGKIAFGVEKGRWVLKYSDDGDLEYLRFESEQGREIYVVSTREPAGPGDIVEAMDQYPGLVEAYNDWIERLEDSLEATADSLKSLPDVGAADDALDRRDEVVESIEEIGESLAEQLHNVSGDQYGTYSTKIDGETWEIKYDGNSAEWLRIGGRGGTYLISQYDPPSPSTLEEYASGLETFVEDVNEHLDDAGEQAAISITVTQENTDREVTNDGE